MGPSGARKNLKRGTSQHPGSFQATFDEIHFIEKYNRQAALYLHRQPDEFFAKDGPINTDAEKAPAGDGGKFNSLTPHDVIESFLEKSKNGNSFTMTYAKAHTDVGGDKRWIAQGISMQNCPSKLRATLCEGVQIDLDIENCGPEILAQLCAKLDIECPKLDDYVKHREDRLEEFAVYLDRGKAKALMIRLINGGSIHADEKEETSGVDWLPNFIAEMWKIRRRIAGLAEYAHVKERFQPKDKDKGLLLPKATNIDAKVVSAVLFPLENQALEYFYNFFKNAGIIKDGECVLVFDGLMVPDNKSNREHLTADFLFKASQYVKEHTGLQLKIRIKEFKDTYELPEDCESVPDNYFVVDTGDDLKPAEILRKAAGDRLVKCGSRYFYNHSGCIYLEGKEEAENGIMNLTREVSIVSDAGEGRTLHYSKNTARVKAATPRILVDESIKDQGFVDKMWEGNLGYLAYTNGVYSFEDGRLLTFEEAKEREIRFIHDTKRAYTAEVDLELKKEVHRRIFDGFMPDAEQQKHYLSSTSRALAGKIGDKRWNDLIGGRNCGKSLQTQVLSRAFGSFVQGTNAENLLTKDGGGQDAAKAQSWIKDLEFKRIVFTNEMPKQGKKIIDGEMVKRICSNGDWIEVRQNYTNENRIRAQASFFLFANDTTEVSPADAYQTMQGFKLDLEYHDQSEFDEKKEQRVEPPSTWRLKDPSIEEFICRPDVIDAFTSIIFEAYTPEKQAPPQRVKDDTNSIKGEASLSVEERFAEIIVKGDKHDVLFTKEIKRTLEECGVGTFSSAKIETLVKQVYKMDHGKPSRKDGQGKSVQDRGFKGLRISDQHYNERDERLKRTEHLKQSARLDFTNPN
jgi:hypothetical protein